MFCLRLRSGPYYLQNIKLYIYILFSGGSKWTESITYRVPSISTYQERSLRRHDRAHAAHHGASAQQGVSRGRGEQLRGVDVDTTECHTDA